MANFNFSVSNTYYAGSPRLDHGGVGFESASNWYNLWIEEGAWFLGSLPVGTPELLGPDVSAFSISVGTASVPEPASWALLIGGFGLTGAALRRRGIMAPVAA